MPTKETGQTSKPDQPVSGSDPTSDIATLQALGFHRMTTFGTAWIELLSDMGSEVVSFVAQRVKEDVKTQHEILRCDDLAELQEIQSRFLKKAMEQYSAETGKLVEISQKILSSEKKKPS